MFKLIFSNFNKKQWGFFFIVVALIVLQVWLELTIPDYMSEITILVQTEGGKMSEILIAGGKMLICAVASAVSAVCVGFFVAQMSSQFTTNVRSKVFNSVQSFSSNEIKKFSTASLITRSTNDINQVQMFLVMGLQALIKSPIMAIWAIIKISGKSYQWSLATAIAVGVLLVAVVIVTCFVIPRFRRIQTLTDNINRITRENLTGLRVVRAYNAESYQQNKFEVANNNLTNNNLVANRVMSLISPLMTAIMSFLPLSIYWIGAYLINAAHFTNKLIIFSDMVVFSSYAIQIVMSFVMLVMVFIMLPRAAVSCKRLNEVLNTKSSILDGKGVKISDEDKGCVEFKNVSFKYLDADEYVLENINFKCKSGDVVAFIGSTGSGKSTLINLVPRFYDASEGEVLVDGKNVKDFSLQDLRKRIGYVSQRAVLFSGSVLSNVAFGGGEDKPNEKDVDLALGVSQSSEFVNNMSAGVQSHISQGGKNVSGGQKQRLSIARALAQNPEILIFDDSFSALDYKTDKAVRQAIKNELKDTTVLIVAQRIGTIKDANKIIVLDEGKIVGIGTHDELMQNCQVYKEIALSQLSEEELKNA